MISFISNFKINLKINFDNHESNFLNLVSLMSFLKSFEFYTLILYLMFYKIAFSSENKDLSIIKSIAELQDLSNKTSTFS